MDSSGSLEHGNASDTLRFWVVAFAAWIAADPEAALAGGGRGGQTAERRGARPRSRDAAAERVRAIASFR